MNCDCCGKNLRDNTPSLTLQHGTFCTIQCFNNYDEDNKPAITVFQEAKTQDVGLWKQHDKGGQFFFGKEVTSQG